MANTKYLNKWAYLILGFLTLNGLVACSNSKDTLQLSITEDQRYFNTSEGEPFLWLGDTAWELFHALTREEASYYLENRAEKGFTVIQAVVLAELDGLNKPNSYGDTPFLDNEKQTINEAYFEHVDYIINEAERLGLFVALLPTWGDKVAKVYKYDQPIFTKESAYTFGKFLSDRYVDKPIVWVLGGDRNITTPEVKEIWQQMAMGIQAGASSNQLMTFHPSGGMSSAKWFHQDNWLSFNACQSGHTRKFDPVYLYSNEHRALLPQKPFINMEPAYEDIGINFWLYRNPEARGLKREDYIAEDGLVIDKSLYAEGCFNDHDVRVGAYWTLLTGAAGYTYGNNAVWQMFKPHGNTNLPALYYWKEALERPGAQSMRYVAKLFTEYPLSSFEPAQEFITSENHMDSTYVVCAVGKEKDFALLYFPSGGRCKINCNDLELKGDLIWFDPRNGERKPSSLTSTQGELNLQAPSSKDWVLILN